MLNLIIDGNSLLNRAFYGLPPLTTKEGNPTGAVYGFITMLSRLLETETPDGLCVAFDLPAPTFRHQMYDGYKAARKPMPEELACQLAPVHAYLEAMRVPVFAMEGYEADDILGTFSRQCADKGDVCGIVTGDRDSFQLIGDKVFVLLVSGKGEWRRVDQAALREQYQLEPAAMIDLKALMGDSSDSIPGVPGVGEKTALSLMSRFHTLDGVYERIDEVQGKLKEKLRDGKDMAYMSRKLAEINRHVPLAVDWTAIKRKPPDRDRLRGLYAACEFRKLLAQLDAQTDKPEAAQTALKSDAPEIERIESDEQWRALCEQMTAPVPFILSEDGQTLTVKVGQRTYAAPMDDTRLAAFMGGDIAKIGADIKTTYRRMLEKGIRAQNFVFDTALALWLTDPVKAPPVVTDLAEMEALFQENPLKSLGMDKLLCEVELPLCEVLARMEHTGFPLNRQALQRFGETLAEELNSLTLAIYEMAGHTFNILSSRQLGEVLFQELGLPPVKKTKTGLSVDAEVLEKLKGRHEMIPLILRHRELSKLKSTYVDGLLTVSQKDGRVHTRFQMTATATGRLSSAEPNLQNIPIRKAQGSALRRMFIPSHEDWVLIDADYSQIELRVLAHIADDPVMKQAFRDGEDIHLVTASQVFGVPREAVTAEQRRRAKAVNFGIVYGISDFALSEDIGVSRAEARLYMEGYMEHYAGVRVYLSEVVERAKKEGYAATLLGRRRLMPELSSSRFHVRSFGERVAMNMPIQGTAADIIKLAMIAVQKRLDTERRQARLLLQVHDELVLECPREEAAAVSELVRAEMMGAYPLDPPPAVDLHIGGNWLEAK